MEFMLRNNAIEQFTALAVLHNDVHIPVVDVAFKELHDVGVVDFLQDGEFFFKQFYVFLNVCSEDGFDCVLECRVGPRTCEPHCAEVASPKHTVEHVDTSDVRRAELCLDLSEHATCRTLLHRIECVVHFKVFRLN